MVSETEHDDVTSRNVPLWQTFPPFFGIKDQTDFKIRKNVKKRHKTNILYSVEDDPMV